MAKPNRNKGIKSGTRPHERECSKHKLVHRPKYRDLAGGRPYARNLVITKREDVNGRVYERDTVTTVTDRVGYISGNNVSGFSVEAPPAKRKVKGI